MLKPDEIDRMHNALFERLSSLDDEDGAECVIMLTACLLLTVGALDRNARLTRHIVQCAGASERVRAWMEGLLDDAFEDDPLTAFPARAYGPGIA